MFNSIRMFRQSSNVMNKLPSFVPIRNYVKQSAWTQMVDFSINFLLRAFVRSKHTVFDYTNQNNQVLHGRKSIVCNFMTAAEIIVQAHDSDDREAARLVLRFWWSRINF